MISNDREPTELKHLSRWRKRKQYAMSLVTSSENGLEQTEFHVVIHGRCGVIDICLRAYNFKLKFDLECRAVEGDSPVDICVVGFGFYLE